MTKIFNQANKWMKLWHLVGNHGLGWVGTRLAYEVNVRSGFQTRRFRQRPWAENELASWLRPEIPLCPAEYAEFRQQNSPNFFFQTADRLAYNKALQKVLGEKGRQTIVHEAEQIKKGNFRYFFAQTGHLGFPPDWHCNPFTGQKSSPTDHWSQIPMYSKETGDLKFIWEPGRFASAYTLARAYWVTGNETYAETFWQLLESWTLANPPNQAAHWRCGQETSLRLMAWCFAYFAIADSPNTTPDRLALLVGSIAAQADRVAGDHIYAYLQKNNHAISEGVGLWTVGILFPELRMAEKWREAGRTMLEEEASRQIYDDGAYIQHATNYHRLMMRDYLWAIRLGELNGYELSPALKDAVQRAGDFLYQLQDDASGQVPNYGSNDGALILPLNGCDYKDFRPVLGTIHYLFYQTRLYPPGLWDEDLIWFFGPEALEREQATVLKQPLQASSGGYYTMRGEKTWGLIRCATFRDRPSQADMLHLDIWRKGLNLAIDPGTYLYYADPPWDNSLVSTLVHNTVSVDGLEQMARGPRFLWLTWIKSQARYHLTSEKGLMSYFEGSHDGYERLPQPITHRRAVLRVEEDIWIVVDDLIGAGEHTFRLHWLLADLPYEVNEEKNQVVLTNGAEQYGLSVCATLPESSPPINLDVLRGSEASAPRGWHSPYYGVRHTAVSVAMSLLSTPPCRFVSIFAPDKSEHRWQVTAEQILFENNRGKFTANLFAPNDVSIIREVILDSPNGKEQLTIS